MTIVESRSSTAKGGAFLIENEHSEQVFIPEEISEEQKMVRDMAEDFLVANEDAMQKLDQQSVLMEQVGALGLLGAHIPEAYGGLGLDANTNAFIAEELGAYAGSFGTSFAAHTGIGMLPILYFGTEAQKLAYLPKMASGEWKGAYCLTEPNSGSDALAARTRADLSDDGSHYLITGQKMWISNAGFADVLIVFAQVNGDQFTGFIVPADLAGISLGAEELKLGIKGSSTRQVFFEKVKVPADLVLGEVGKGHLIAFNALNTGRFKLGNMCMGGAKRAVTRSIQYANERHQFKRPISSFGAIKAKLAQQAIRSYGVESMVYRVSDLMERHKEDFLAQGLGVAEAKLKAAEEMAIECAIIKIAGSEVLDYVVDEMVQIFGGNGFSEEYPAARAYRDQRISRIYEGTNEINRMLMIKMLLKRAMKGKLDLLTPAMAIKEELSQAGVSSNGTNAGIVDDQKVIMGYKKATLLVIAAAAQKQMEGAIDLNEEQEILMSAANMMIETYLVESAMLRIRKSSSMVRAASDGVYDAVVSALCYEAADLLQKNAKDALVSFTSGKELSAMLAGVAHFCSYEHINIKEARRTVADHIIEEGSYAL